MSGELIDPLQATPRNPAYLETEHAQMTEPPGGSERLDSWKAVAKYLKRDLATVRRWEKTLGLPIHRVGRTGRSVFAYAHEIDEWLHSATPASATVEPLTPAPAPGPAIVPFPWRWPVVAALVLVAAIALSVRARSTMPGDLRFELAGADVIASDNAGDELWRHRVPSTCAVPAFATHAQLIGGTDPGVYVATSFCGEQGEDQVESGALTLLDINGRAARSFSFADRVTFDGKQYGAPWAITAFSVNEAASTRRIAVAAHHYVWNPGLVTILDDQWSRRGTFVNAGWIEMVRWLGVNRLLVSGFSNAHDGGMIALLDADALDGQSPEPAGSEHFCSDCSKRGPLRMYVFPRSEVNRASGSAFNRAIVQTSVGANLVARTIEMTSNGADADVLYEFDPVSLDLVSARFSERYWEMHRALEADGKIPHSREQCPDSAGPRQVLAWEPAAGWRALRLR